MGFLSKFEGKMEDTIDAASDKMSQAPLSPVQIAKKAEKQMRREKMVGAGKQYAPTLYTILVNDDDDQRLFGYYPTLAGETETYLAAKAVEHGLIMDGQPLVRFIVDDDLRRGKFEVIAEMVAAPLVAQLRQEEMERYGLITPPNARGVSYQSQGGAPAAGHNQAAAVQSAAAASARAAQTVQNNGASANQAASPSSEGLTAYLYDITNDKAFTLTGKRYRIGRESQNDIVVPDINASRIHAEVRQDAQGNWSIEDLGSLNGTVVNGQKVKTANLADADRIIIGTTQLEFQLI